MHISKKALGIVAAVGAIVALTSTGAAVAGGLITTAQIKDGAVTSAKVKDGTLAVKDFSASERAKLAAAPLDTKMVESPTVVVPAYDSGVVIAYCPAGKKVTGGGYFSSIAVAAGSAPNVNQGWGVVINNYKNSTPVEVNAYAVCA